MKALSPGQTLVFLILFCLAIAGWLYGIHWKRTASGGMFTADEKLIIQLQDQIRVLSEDNAELNGKIAELAKESEEAPSPSQ